MITVSSIQFDDEYNLSLPRDYPFETVVQLLHNLNCDTFIFGEHRKFYGDFLSVLLYSSYYYWN
jgi:hypothetical protein